MQAFNRDMIAWSVDEERPISAFDSCISPCASGWPEITIAFETVTIRL
jgi:hypothetical protein